MKFVDKTLNFITKEMNITSISPLFIFDVAKIGPGRLRRWVELATLLEEEFGLRSSARRSVNLGYAFTDAPPDEGRGAFFFSLTTRNLLE